MNWYRRLIAAAGLGNAHFGLAVVSPLLASTLLGLVCLGFFGVLALCIAAFFLSLTLQIELLRVRANRRAAVISRAWPEVVETLQSALQSGITVANSFDDLAMFGPIELRKVFQTVSKSLGSGHDLNHALNWMKQELATEPSDRTVEALKLIETLGGYGAQQTLTDLATQLRKHQQFESELAAKQGWVVATAKLGLAAPWVIVLLLSRRPETAQVYNSSGGVLALSAGLAVCLVAYLMIHLIASPVQPKRVFINAY